MAPGSEEFICLARRPRYETSAEHLRDDLTRLVADVQEINRRLLAGKVDSKRAGWNFPSQLFLFSN